MIEFGLHPGILFGLAIGLFLLFHIALDWPLPVAFIAVAAATAFLGDFGIPFRHLVEGGFGFINLILALFGGAFFGQPNLTRQGDFRGKDTRTPLHCQHPEGDSVHAARHFGHLEFGALARDEQVAIQRKAHRDPVHMPVHGGDQGLGVRRSQKWH